MGRKFTIGRDRVCDVLIGDDSVSRIHAEIWLENGRIMLADRGSSNGTKLLRGGNSTSVSCESLQSGDQVKFGGVTLDLKDLIEAVELKNPGALTAKAGPPPLPNPPPPPVARAAPTPPPKQGPVLVRCDCGAIKTAGQPCPGCHR
jgi:predicted component of type VI protein secretion system